MMVISAYHKFKHKVSLNYTNIYPLKTWEATYISLIWPSWRNISQVLWQAPVWTVYFQQLRWNLFRDFPSPPSWGFPSFHSCGGSPVPGSCVFFLGLFPCFGKMYPLEAFLQKPKTCGIHTFWSTAFLKTSYSNFIHKWCCAYT